MNLCAVMSARVLNFGAGPGALPESVLATMRDEMLDYRGTGMSVAELSHRSKAFLAILEDGALRRTVRRKHADTPLLGSGA